MLRLFNAGVGGWAYFMLTFQDLFIPSTQMTRVCQIWLMRFRDHPNDSPLRPPLSCSPRTAAGVNAQYESLCRSLGPFSFVSFIAGIFKYGRTCLSFRAWQPHPHRSKDVSVHSQPDYHYGYSLNLIPSFYSSILTVFLGLFLIFITKIVL